MREKPAKMGFDFIYFLPCRCTVCGTYFQARNDELWENRCPDCAPELYRKPEESLTEE